MKWLEGGEWGCVVGRKHFKSFPPCEFPQEHSRVKNIYCLHIWSSWWNGEAPYKLFGYTTDVNNRSGQYTSIILNGDFKTMAKIPSMIHWKIKQKLKNNKLKDVWTDKDTCRMNTDCMNFGKKVKMKNVGYNKLQTNLSALKNYVLSLNLEWYYQEALRLMLITLKDQYFENRRGKRKHW